MVLKNVSTKLRLTTHNLATMKFLNKKLFLFLIFSLFLITGFFVFNNLAQAQSANLDVGLAPVAETGLSNTDIRTVVARIIKAALGLLGIVALCLVLYAGYLWMTAAGDDEKINTSKKILINATIGLVIILSAYSIVSFVMNKLVEATTGNSTASCQQQKDNGGSVCGGACPACTPTCPYGNCDGKFKIVEMPVGGKVCVQNVAPAIVFNLDVDIDSLKNRIVVINASTSVPVVGNWSLQLNHHHIAYFKPTAGACPMVDGGQDCFAASTTFKIQIKNGGTGIKSANGKDLNCLASSGGCADVTFASGEGADRNNPTISILSPTINDSNLKQGDVIGVQVSFKDDGGIQNLVLNADDILVDSQSLGGCQKTGTVTINWPTNNLTVGMHSLQAIGLDWAANSAEADSKANLKPAHCFNKSLDASLGEKFIDCGGVCGTCDGDKCTVDANCTSGFCLKNNPSDAEGVCVEKTYISSFSPSEAAVGDYVSIVGKNFGTIKGHVYFAKVNNPNISIATDWTEAQVVNCGAGFNNWSDNQIIVVVPNDAIAGKIAVFNANATGANQFNVKYFDTTGTGFKKVPNFILSNISHPGICALNPNSGAVGTNVGIKGKNFGAYNPASSFVTFNDKTKTNIVGWGGELIESIVPSSLGNGLYSVKVATNNLSSNSLLFDVSGSNLDAPFISEISAPASTTIGDYLTISGKNFGNQIGAVWFKASGVANASSINGSFDFPSACKNSVWKDTQIVVKVPTGLALTNYTIQVFNSFNSLNSALDNTKIVKINTGNPSPGICKISPLSGSLPFSLGNAITVYGEYLDKVTKYYFWKTGGNSNNITNTLVGVNVVTTINGQSLTVFPSSTVANVGSIISGLTYAYQAADQKQSNGILFSTNDCVKSGCASSGDKCCMVGSQAGMCKPKGDLCQGEFKSSGFVWLFSTKTIVPPPKVVERCDAGTEAGNFLPSPSPSTMWNIVGKNDASNVCLTALVTVEFSSALVQASVNADTVIVKSCNSIGLDGVCVGASDVTLNNNSFVLNVANNSAGQNLQQYLSLKPQAGTAVVGKWDQNKLYQVILKTGITSIPNVKGEVMPLAVSKSCGNGTAYCFTFKTGVFENGKGDCVLKQVIITPNNFWSKYLESPMRYHTVGGDVYDVFYKGNGLSTQYCTMMDTTAYDWSWSVDNKNPGKIYAEINGVANKNFAQVNTKGNTVNVGVAKDSVNVVATATQSGISKVGTSPLTIDLSNPEIVDYWPNCLEACTTAAVGARFNITMSKKNVDAGSPTIKLVRCNDENCLSTSAPLVLASSFDAVSGNTILKIANYGVDAGLEPNALYQVSLSTSSVPNAKYSNDQLWSISDSSNLSNITNFSKPYNKTFTWRFRTKKEACKVDRVEILPKVFTASKLKDLAIFEAQPYAAPDACSKTGQKLNPWTLNWNWSSSVTDVADVYKPLFKTKGSSAFCTANCILKGSTVPSGVGSNAYPICGNGKVEAGEDCDVTTKSAGCGLDCRFVGNSNTTTCGNGIVENNLGEACDPKNPQTSVGCSNLCLKVGSSMQTSAKDVNASICGNGMVGSGEDCDLGVPANQNSPSSSMYCSEKCLHIGTRLSSKWCFEHDAAANPAFGGFDQKEYNFFCNQSYSQCGDGITSPDEDANCDLGGGKHNVFCNDRCLNISKDVVDLGCAVNKEGCDENAQHIGSSLLYAVPSLCGDGDVGTGEDADCESPKYLTNLWHGNLFDPWVLVIGKAGAIGKSVGGVVTAQETIITGTGTLDSKSSEGKGKYQVLCGYKTDDDCKSAYGNNAKIGVGNDSCCYNKSKLVSVYPGNTSTVATNFETNVCINTFVEARFDSVIDQTTLPGNFIIARSMKSACTSGMEDVSSTISFLASADSSLPWYKNVWKKIVVTIKNIFGNEVNANTWCAGADVGAAQVVADGNGGSKILFKLNSPLASSTDYVVILKNGIKNIQGVSIENQTDGKSLAWRFKTNDKICEIVKVKVDPDQHYFSAPSSTIDLVATGLTPSGQWIQPVNGYKWEYQWGPKNSPFVSIANTTSTVNSIVSLNNNGEVDVHAAANITENKLMPTKIGLVGTGKSHVIVFLCENPWPPKQLPLASGQTAMVFPYEDKIKNNDGFDLTKNLFNNTPTLAANVGSGYFNFSTYYCADNGNDGTEDDLPYLRPAVQADVNAFGVGITTSTFVTISTSTIGHCANNATKACTTDANCEYQTVSLGPTTFVKNKSGICTIVGAGGSFNYYFELNGVFTGGMNGTPLLCDAPADCFASTNFANQVNASGSTGGCNSLSWLVPTTIKSTCLGTTTTTKKEVVALLPESLKALKRFILTNNKNNDAIGIQILSNPKHLSPREWFTASKNAGGQSFSANLQDTTVDGYDAVSDGNNFYVSALNFDQSAVPSNGNLYTNIYLFSISDDASPETKKVFESLKKNLKFNINLTNYGYCGKDVNNPGIVTQCKSDFDCSNGEVCSAQKDKIKRNFIRLQDMSNIQKGLLDFKMSNGNNTFPLLTAGTYLSGQTISTWPSWSSLDVPGSAKTPSDPINKLGMAGTCSSSTGQFCLNDDICKTKNATETCILHTPETGWSTADKRFSFACNVNSLAYRYFATSSNYSVKLRLEDSGLIVDNLSKLVDDFGIDKTRFNILDNNINGICSQSNEITTMSQGKCGDGQVNLNKGELCDPPGSVVWNQASCGAGATSASIMTGKICANDCKWSPTATTTNCGILAKCGNGKVEIGEFCDEGSLNNQYNHCNSTCTKLTSSCGDKIADKTNEFCDIAKDYYPDLFYTNPNIHDGWCVGGIAGSRPCGMPNDCRILPENPSIPNSPALIGTTGKCVPISIDGNLYGSQSDKSCNSDCQKSGPFCGDNVVQAEFGEECDGSAICSIAGLSGSSGVGKQLCGNDCRWSYNSSLTSPILYFSFDDVVNKQTGWNPISNNVIGGLSYILNKGSIKKTSDLLYSSAYCVGEHMSNGECPAPTPTYDVAKYKDAMSFNGIKNYFIVDHNTSLDLNEITFATWINVDPTSNDSWNPILNKNSHKTGAGADNRNDNHDRDFAFYFDYDKATGKIVKLHMYSSHHQEPYVTGGPNYPIFGISDVTTNFSAGEWHFIAVTVNAERETRYYLDNILLNAGGQPIVNGSTTLKANNKFPIWIGRGDDTYFKGAMDELKLFGRALSPEEITDLYKNSKNFCQLNNLVGVSSASATDATASCGNGKVDANEACDAGTKNGIPCVPAYNKTCSYCLEGCKSTKVVNSLEYCGDGKINGTETCDSSSDLIFSKSTSTYAVCEALNPFNTFFPDYNGYNVPNCSAEYNLTFNNNSESIFNANKNNCSALSTSLIKKIGTKSCSNNCTSIVDKCVACGLQAGGVEVSGAVINVLQPKSNNPLLADVAAGDQGTINLMYNKNGQAANLNQERVAFHYYDESLANNEFILKANSVNPALPDNNAEINSDPTCSSSSERTYKIALNNDWANNHLIDFPVSSAAAAILNPEKYNLILSPVINQSVQPQNIRVVVSWVGDGMFNGGFLVPVASPGYFYNYKNITGNSLIRENNIPNTEIYTGTDYYKELAPSAYVWNHGYVKLNNSSIDSFTINNSIFMATSAYAFYVRAPSGQLNDLKNSSKLKVEIYTPEIDTKVRYFARPVATYYLNVAIPSSNQDAEFWHVFNVNSVPQGVISTLENSIKYIGRISTQVKMNY